MCPISKKQQKSLEFVKQFHRQRGFPPSIREIGSHFNIKSPNGVKYHLNVLEREGLLSRQARTARGLQAKDLPEISSMQPIPVVGRVAAGGPNLAFEEIERELLVDPTVFGPTEQPDSLFALRISGDSMKGVGIFEGDIAIVRKQHTASLGEIIVALLEEEATVKRYLPKNGYIVLQPENDAYDPIVLSGNKLDDFKILGKVIGLLRTKL